MTDSYVAVDLETTGIGAKKEKITEIGMVKVKDGIVTDTYHTMVNPHKEIPENIVSLTGIDDDMVKDAPSIEDVIREAVDFCEDLPLLGHQLIFDYGFLKQSAVNLKIPFEKYGIDTLKLCRKFMPAEEKKNLGAALRYFGVVPATAHRALADAESAHLLYTELKKRYLEKGPKAFDPVKLNYQAKKEKQASKRQKQHLQDLIKYHKIKLTVSLEHMSGNEMSRLTDQIIFKYGRIPKESGSELRTEV